MYVPWNVCKKERWYGCVGMASRLLNLNFDKGAWVTECAIGDEQCGFMQGRGCDPSVCRKAGL